MDASQAYLIAAIVVLLVVIVLVFFFARSGHQNRLTPLASLAFAFVLSGILFGDNRAIGYGLMGIGVLFAVVDIFRRSKTV